VATLFPRLDKKGKTNSVNVTIILSPATWEI